MYAMVSYMKDAEASTMRTLITEDAPVGQVVKQLRCRLRLSQERFAAVVGVSFPTVNRWEKGHATPSPLALQRISELAVALNEKGSDIVSYLNTNGWK
jgi:DNA-binding transcriptional regulator YiaG